MNRILDVICTHPWWTILFMCLLGNWTINIVRAITGNYPEED